MSCGYSDEFPVQPYRTLLGVEGSARQVTTEEKTRQQLKRATGHFATNDYVVENLQCSMGKLLRGSHKALAGCRMKGKWDTGCGMTQMEGCDISQEMGLSTLTDVTRSDAREKIAG